MSHVDQDGYGIKTFYTQLGTFYEVYAPDDEGRGTLSVRLTEAEAAFIAAKITTSIAGRIHAEDNQEEN